MSVLDDLPPEAKEYIESLQQHGKIGNRQKLTEVFRNV